MVGMLIDAHMANDTSTEGYYSWSGAWLVHKLVRTVCVEVVDIAADCTRN